MTKSSQSRKSLQRWQRIYVNRSVNMEKIKSIGFDMDHTLAVYNRHNFESLAFNATLQKFIDAGYPEELAQLTFDDQFVVRGLLVDRARGNLLKVDSHKYVKQAFHGRQELTKQERHNTYNAQSFKAEDFLSIDTFFALSEVQLFVEIVDYMRRNPGKIERSFAQVYSDLRKFIDLSHADGSIKNTVLADLGNFVHVNKHLDQTLKRLIDGGKQLFLLTNSHFQYTDAVMNHLFAENDYWRDYFHYIIVGASKPGFFTGTQPFYAVDPDSGLLSPRVSSLESGKIYHGGNGHLFQELTGQRGDQILYCGDHIYGDIIRSKGEFNWRTFLIIEELYEQLSKYEEMDGRMEAISEQFDLKEQVDEERQRSRSLLRSNSQQLRLAQQASDPKKVQSLLKNQTRIETRLTELDEQHGQVDSQLKKLIKERESLLNPNWGDFLAVGLEGSRLAKQIEEYACLYTTEITNLRFYSPFKRFMSPMGRLPHQI